MSAIPGTASGTEVDKATLLEVLREGGEAFLQSVAGVSEATCRLRPEENRWSALECAEHVAVAEEVMLGLVTGERKTRNAEKPKRDGRILRSATDRSVRFDASAQSRPRGRFSTLAEAVAHFLALRGRTLRLVAETKEDLRATEVTHPHQAVGVISTYECLLLMGTHVQRHALQIEEVKSSPAYRTGART
ncbi:MAG: DinB family protein [Terriglobales bacterium]|jgi:DinB family protein